MKNKKVIKHRIAQKTANRKKVNRRRLNSLKGSTNQRSREMPVRVPLPMPAGLINASGKLGEYVKAAAGKG